MGEPLLLLRLEGPLQAWGARARWDVRDTEREPTKSGIVGLLGAALGYERGDPRLADELDAGLRLGVRVEQEGRVLVDYHTVTDFLPIADGRFKHSGVQTATSLAKLHRDPDVEPATIQSFRRYLEDASFLAVLAARPAAPAGLLARCADALRRPAWPLFLGRKACVPTRPIFVALTDAYASLEDALVAHPWSCMGAGDDLRAFPRGRAPECLRVVIETADEPGAGEARDSAHPFWCDPPTESDRQDALGAGAARFYRFRRVREGAVPFPGRAREAAA